MSDPRRLKVIADAVRRGTPADQLAFPIPLPDGIDYAAQNVAYFGTPDGPITPDTIGDFEQIASTNTGGSGSLPAPPLGPGPAGFFWGVTSMANVKATFEFLGVDGETWGEDWWTNLSGVGSFRGTPETILASRLALLSTPHKLARVRYVQDDATRLTAVEDVFRNGTRIPTSAGISPSDLSLTISLGLADGTSRKWWCRGVADSDWGVGITGKHIIAGGFPANLATFVNALATASWGVRRLTRVPLRPPNVTYMLTVDGKTTPGMSLVTCVAAHNLLVGDEVIIYRTSEKDLPRLRGHWRVAGLTSLATQFYVNYRTPLDTGPIPAGGFVRKATYAGVVSFAQANTATVPPNPRLLHVAHHDTKEALFGSRGARRAKQLRQSS